jgi:hypothetical protein
MPSYEENTNLSADVPQTTRPPFRMPILKFKDPDTGVRVMQLTGDSSDNVHLYFTSESFFGGGSDRVVFGSNRSGQFQFYMLEIRERKLVQLTEGQHEPQQACLSPNGHLYYFDGPVLRAVKLDSLDDRELSASPKAGRPILPHARPKGSMSRSRIARSSR